MTSDQFEGWLDVPESMHKYMYAKTNPVMYIDPNGLQYDIVSFSMVRLIDTALRALETTMVVTTGIMIGAATICAVDVTMHNVLTEIEQEEAFSFFSSDWQREIDHTRYKNRCDEKPPSGLSQCEYFRWRIKQHQDCADMMKAFDKKWGQPDRHRTNILIRLKRAADFELSLRIHKCK